MLDLPLGKDLRKWRPSVLCSSNIYWPVLLSHVDLSAVGSSKRCRFLSPKSFDEFSFSRSIKVKKKWIGKEVLLFFGPFNHSRVSEKRLIRQNALCVSSSQTCVSLHAHCICSRAKHCLWWSVSAGGAGAIWNLNDDFSLGSIVFPFREIDGK